MTRTRGDVPLPDKMVPFLSAVPVERREERVVEVALSSAWADYDGSTPSCAPIRRRASSRCSTDSLTAPLP
ncbi:hypothetical protein ACFRFL_24705 [Streptomyces sp. NPDC056708]|uniref:hypothetical protein n=1 Tax=unclassified Streptomyces TaxID=2593676 RepID=UPI0036782691